MSFQISDKVVCVDDSPGSSTLAGEYSFPNGYVQKGALYVINGLGCMLGTGETGVTVVGLPAIWLLDNTDTGWQPSRFRKLSEIQAENRAKWEQENQQYYELLK